MGHPDSRPDAQSSPPARSGALIPKSILFHLLIVFFVVSSAFAVDPTRRISQYGHTAWRVQDGEISPGTTITQTVDGYIWLGTSDGLMRFDGVRFVPWAAPKGSSPLSKFTSLLGSRDGSLWIGTRSGLARLKDGQLDAYTKPTETAGISVIIEDHAGNIWATRYHIPNGDGPLCKVVENALQCFGKKDGIPVSYALGVTEDSLGNLWFGSSVLCRWRPGSSSTYFDDVLKNRQAGQGVVDVAAGDSGTLWASIDGMGPQLGVRQYSAGKWTSYAVPGFDGATVRSHALFVDHNKTLWIGTENNGLFRVHDGVADHYGSADGLTGNSVVLFYEDHEGNVWVVTEGGVDKFRDTPVVSFSMHEGLAASSISSILARRDGSVSIGNEGALNILRAGHVSGFLAGHGLPGQDVGSQFEDHTGKLWLGIDNKLMTYEKGRFREVRKPNGGALGSEDVLAITEDSEHEIWVLKRDQHLFRIVNNRVLDDIPLGNDLPNPGFLAADQEAGIWICTRTGVLAHYVHGTIDQKSSFADAADGVASFGLAIDADNSLLVPTVRGLYRWKSGRWNLLNARNGLPCNSIFSAIKDNHGALWLHAQCGLIQIPASELAKWHEQPDSQLSVGVWDALDGARPGRTGFSQPQASKGIDGRLWFTNGVTAQSIDPDHLYRNSMPPPVHIQRVVADGKSYQAQDKLRLPALTRDLEIDYAALSFTLPQRVRFRYKLEGHDAEWQEPGSRRQAFYGELGPGSYKFRIIACNNDGIWNLQGSALEFSIAAAWYQTLWFRILSILLLALLVWVVYRFRVRQVARAISARFDERLGERTRLARELHDTFLQTIQGSKMVAEDALEQPADYVRMRRAMERLSQWLDRATTEGRAALNSLRTSTIEGNDLAEALQRATENSLIPISTATTFSVVGEAREMHPIVRDEVYRIGYEAIRNACVHSSASRLDVELRYSHDLTVRVSDNGVGMDATVATKGKDGHFGLQGMKERAARIEGKLTILSSATSGTEVTLVVPGGIVFRKKAKNDHKPATK
jgi:signal transduction histidine kinase/ligand-binding sensor domain-containing protein